MVIRLIQSAAVLALLASGGVGFLCAHHWSGGSDTNRAIRTAKSAVQAFSERDGRDAKAQERASPLVTQAEALAAFLKPPPPPRPKPPAPERKPVKSEPVPAIRPMQATPKFTVCATSFNETRPEKSLVLISEPGGEAAYWVREGDRVGHFTIHEIKPGSVVYLAGEELCEMAVKREEAATILAGGRGPSSEPQTAAAAQASPPEPAGPSRRPTRTNRRTVGSVRNRIVD